MVKTPERSLNFEEFEQMVMANLVSSIEKVATLHGAVADIKNISPEGEEVTLIITFNNKGWLKDLGFELLAQLRSEDRYIIWSSFEENDGQLQSAKKKLDYLYLYPIFGDPKMYRTGVRIVVETNPQSHD